MLRQDPSTTHVVDSIRGANRRERGWSNGADNGAEPSFSLPSSFRPLCDVLQVDPVLRPDQPDETLEVVEVMDPVPVRVALDRRPGDRAAASERAERSVGGEVVERCAEEDEVRPEVGPLKERLRDEGRILGGLGLQPLDLVAPTERPPQAAAEFPASAFSPSASVSPTMVAA